MNVLTEFYDTHSRKLPNWTEFGIERDGYGLVIGLVKLTTDNEITILANGDNIDATQAQAIITCLQAAVAMVTDYYERNRLWLKPQTDRQENEV